MLKKHDLKNLCSRKLWELLRTDKLNRMEQQSIINELELRGHYQYELALSRNSFAYLPRKQPCLQAQQI